ncbi:MAG: HPr family phosphocarrier protein [Geminicoccaceae bacterium]
MTDAVLSRETTIVNQRGLHARAAAKFVRTAATFVARVEVTRDDQTVAGTSILGLMLLGAGIGTMLTLRAEGDDAVAALAVLGDLIERGFDE